MPVARAHRHLRSYTLLLLILSLVTLLPGQPTSAAVATDTIQLDNTQAEFAGGTFQRSSVSPAKRTDLTPGTGEVADVAGSIQLAPAGTLKAWSELATPLAYGGADIGVSNAGVTALGTRLYVVGGTQTAAQTNDFSSDIYWADVNPKTGTLIGETGNIWKHAALQATQPILDNGSGYGISMYAACKQVALSGRRRHSMVSLATGTNTGYLYVIGGEFDTSAAGCGTHDFSSAVVQRGTVNSLGNISWHTFPIAQAVPSPHAEGRYLGVDSASSVIAEYHDSNGNTHYYLYVIGGRSYYLAGDDAFLPDSPLETLRKTVYYTEIRISDGELIDPDTSDGVSSVWKRDSDIQFYTLIPELEATEGLFESTASVASVTVGNTFKSSIFLAGGSHDAARTRINSFIYRADVGANGALDWGSSDPDKTIGEQSINMTGRLGMSSIAYNNKLYLIGGRTSSNNASAKSSVPTTFLNDSLDTITIDPSATTPIIGETSPVLGDDTIDNPNNRRFASGVAIVKAEPPDTYDENTTLTSAWVFVIGGSNINGLDTNTIYQGKIGSEEAKNTSYTPDGWYYSNIFETSYVFGSESGDQYEQSRLVAFHWAVDIDRSANASADALVYFRSKTTLNGRCTGSNVFSDSDTWIGPLDSDGSSGNGLYSTDVASGALYSNTQLKGVYNDTAIIGNCLQYRVQLLRGGSNSTVTPKLLSVVIEKEILGNADLNIPTTNGFVVTKTSDGQLSDLLIRVQNLNVQYESRTISVPKARVANDLTADGDLFVNLCVVRSDLNAAAPTLVLPDPKTFTLADKTICRYYAQLHTTLFDAKTILDLTASGNTYWHDNLNSGQVVPDIKKVFKASGQYKIGLILDTYNYLPEGDTGETNNQSTIYEFVNTNYSVMLPMVVR